VGLRGAQQSVSMVAIMHKPGYIMRRILFYAAVACLAVGALAWGLVQNMRGPALPGYDVTAGPLVQTVVATGRVAPVSRAQVGSQVTGVVIERRVKEGDLVQP